MPYQPYQPETEAPFDGVTDPEVMPGFTTELISTLPAPWPPLSWKQVVTLHEALTEFLSLMEYGYGGPNEEMMDAATAARRLEPKLLDLGIGMLPAQKSHHWTREEINAALTKREQEGFACLDERRMLPPKEPTATFVASPFGKEEPKHNCWSCRHAVDSEGWGCTSKQEAIWQWAADQKLIFEEGHTRPERTADGCPGWEREP